MSLLEEAKEMRDYGKRTTVTQEEIHLLIATMNREISLNQARAALLSAGILKPGSANGVGIYLWQARVLKYAWGNEIGPIKK